MIHKKNNQNFNIEQKQLFKIPLEVQRHEGVLWDRLWTCPGSRTQGAAATVASPCPSLPPAEPRLVARQERHLPLVSGLDGDAADAWPPAPCDLLAF